jgi:hypothetical protein
MEWSQPPSEAIRSRNAIGFEMLFIHPMWDNECQRIGKRRCTPVGYALHGIAELIGYLGLLMLIAMPAVLVYDWFAGKFHASLWWLLALPFGLGIVSEGLFAYSWWLAARKGFRYDYERREASWMEAGERRTYKYGVEPASRRRSQ